MMPGPSTVRRPTEDAALRQLKPSRVSPERVADLLTVARATGDRYGEVLFDHILDRALGGVR
jgi:hypothetical protein